MDSFSVAKLESLLGNRTVWIWLSPEGQQAVKRVFEKDAFRVHVEVVDALGLWLRPSKPGNTLLLLKWDYLGCAQLWVVHSFGLCTALGCAQLWVVHSLRLSPARLVSH